MRYAKKYVGLIVLAIFLVVVQAYCDLELPKYMSNMINIGIRQGGIEDWLPDVFSQKTFEELSLLTSDDFYSELQSKYYIGINRALGEFYIDSKEYGTFSKRYGKLDEGEEVYVLRTELDFFRNDLSAGDLDVLKEAIKVPIVVYAMFNEMFSVSAVGFLEEREFLAAIWAGFSIEMEPFAPDDDDSERQQKEAEYMASVNAYAETNKDKPLGWFFDELKSLSVTPREYGPGVKYGTGEKSMLIKIVSMVLNNEISSNLDPETENALREALEKAGLSHLMDTVIDSAKYAAFGGNAKQITDYILELGNIRYKIGEYGRAGADTGKIQMDYLLKNGLIMLLYTIGGVAAAVAVMILSSKVAAGSSRDLRLDIFAKIQSFSNAEFDKFSTASLITRTSNDVSQLQTLFFFMVKNALYSALIVFGGLFYVVFYILEIQKPENAGNAYLMYIIGIAIAVISIGVIALFFTVMPRFRKMQKLLDKINLVSRERLQGLFVIRANNNEPREKRRYEEVNLKIMRVNLFINRLMAIMTPFMTLFMNVIGILLVRYAVGENLLIQGQIKPGSLLAFIQYAAQMISAFLLLSGNFVFLPRAMVAMNRLWEILKVKPSVADPAQPVRLGSKAVNVGFNDVSFRYAKTEKYALRNISFSAEAGKTTAVVGATGSGKTTLIQLLLRFYDPERGNININGNDIRTLAQDDFRSKIGYVPQRPALFSGTVGDNLLSANENASRGDMDDAVISASAGDFIKDGLSGGDKYGAQLGKAGKNLSGGQKQRLSIARAIIRKPAFYIFDDSFSALDYITEAKLRAELSREAKDRGAGILIVSQRIASILNADKIVVLENGSIVGQGSHSELLKSCSIYREIAESQLPREELESYGTAENKGGAL